ncbi:MAG TPA: hypothetical protein DEP65_09460 [Ruminococcus sp.]|nr:hypothetical protein [Ruminococcus sp.]
MLVCTNEKILNICSKVGYQDVKYFSKLFKKYTNTTPSQYRSLVMQTQYTLSQNN